MRKVFFMIDGALKMKENILKKSCSEHLLYGGIELEKKGTAVIEDYTFGNILKKKRGDVVVTNRTKHIFLMRLLGVKAILIDINSNHDLKKHGGIKGFLKYLMYKKHYSFCSAIVCLSRVQVKKLKEIGVKNIHVIPLGVNEKDFEEENYFSGDYFLSSGGDKGKNHAFVSDALKGYRVKILGGETLVEYNEYLAILKKSKALVLNVNTDAQFSSDLSGTTTCFEALLAKKPIFINDQPWLKELLKDNYYVYDDDESLKKLIRKNVKFRDRDYGHITLKNFVTELKGVINSV